MTQFAIKRTGDADYPRHLKVLVQGPPKSGKTMFISTAPNVVVAACEAGLATIAHLDIPYVSVDSTEKLQNLEMILRDDTLRDHAAKQQGMPKIETVAIDTLDAWQEVLKREILAENRRTQMQQADWGTLKERMSTIMKRFVSLPVNVIFTVHTSTTQDDEQRLIYAPALQGSIKDEIAGYVDYSLLSFRQRETGADGVTRINYYLKCEGDQKNPHLGNRAAGRLPEICAPQFAVLHNAVFSAIPTRTIPMNVIKEVPDRTPEPVAQSPSQPAPVVTPAPPSGIPEDDPSKPITASGISMLTKEYTAQGLLLPVDLNSWTLGKGWQIAKWFVAWKTDMAAGGSTITRDDLVEGLKSYDGFAGEMEGVQTGVENLKPGKAKSLDNPPQDKPKTDDADVEESAMNLLQDQLGAVVIGHEVAADAKCDVCGDQVDDPDIANLGLRRFKKALCIKDYKQAVAEARQ